MEYPDARILVFAKPPVAGYCKTRLGRKLGYVRAAGIHRDLSELTLAMLNHSAIAPIEIHAAGSLTHPWFMQQKRLHHCPIVRQANGDLGQRMLNAARATLTTASTCLIVGTDCPLLGTEHLHSALIALESGQDVVLLPSEDGGYALIGLRCVEPLIFRGIAWGRSSVMQQTRQRLRRSGLKWAELAPVWDVDQPADFQRARRLQLV